MSATRSGCVRSISTTSRLSGTTQGTSPRRAARCWWATPRRGGRRAHGHRSRHTGGRGQRHAGDDPGLRVSPSRRGSGTDRGCDRRGAVESDVTGTDGPPFGVGLCPTGGGKAHLFGQRTTRRLGTSLRRCCEVDHSLTDGQAPRSDHIGPHAEEAAVVASKSSEHVGVGIDPGL